MKTLRNLFSYITRPTSDEWLLLRVLAIFSGGFGALPIALAWLKADILFGGTTKVSIPLEIIFNSSSVVISLLKYLMVFSAAYLLYAVLIWLLCLPLARKLGGERGILILRGTLVYSACTWWVVLFHSKLYPNSLMAVSNDTPQFAWAFTILSAGVIALVGGAFYVFLNSISMQRRKWAIAMLVVGLSVGTVSAYVGEEEQIKPGGEVLPDVIVIGVDSLRPDHLQRLGFAENLTPNLNSLLSESAVFEKASTPLARTFPSWLSLLTGLEPLRHGGRFNLMPQEMVDRTKSIAHDFQRHGYRTIYATDESRFSNIDSAYGFEEVLAPAYGFSDFLLGSINDAPLTNLLVNSPVGGFLLPSSNANRAAHTTYRPETFDAGLHQLIGAGDARPLFLAVHFCLPHWPYVWSEKNTRSFSGYGSSTKNADYQFYLNSLHRVDRQVGELVRYLEKIGRLNNALVVFISDHGESFMLDRDRLSSGGASGRVNPLPQLFGHAVSVLDASQYHVLLAFRGYGNAEVIANTFSVPVSLIDVAPTLLQYVFAESVDGLDGLPLVDAIRGRGLPPLGRFFIRESGFSVPAIHDLSLNMADVFHQGAVYYDLTPTDGRLELKNELLGKLLRDKQRAIVMGRWVLAFMPERQGGVVAYLIDSESKCYWLESEFAGTEAPTELLIAELCRRYASEEEFLPGRFCGVKN